MSSARTVTVEEQEGVLRLSGELDAGGAHEVHTALSDRVGQGRGDVVLDLSGLAFIDSIGLGALVKAAVQLDRQGRRLRVVGVQGAVRIAIESMGLSDRLGVEDAEG